MVKRYYGGLISSTKRTTSVGNFVSGIYNKNTHLQATFADAFPPYDLRDTYFKYTSLLLNGNPPSPTFVTDASTNSFQLSIAGDTKPNNFNPYQAGYYSNYFDGTGDYLEISSSTAFALGTGNFTIEAWIYPLAYGSSIVGGSIFGTTAGATTGYSLNLGQTQDTLRIISNASGTWADNLTVSSGGGAPLNTWSHIAWVRNGDSMSIYKNGVSVATMSGVSGYNFTSPNNTGYIGYFSDGTYTRYFNGYISNLRVVKGTALYTTTFTPSTTPLTSIANTSVLTCQSNRFIDNSTNNFTITKYGDSSIKASHPFVSPYGSYASTYFDGSGDNLSIPNNSVFNFGTGNFTVEFWLYCVSTWSSMSNPGIAGQKTSDATTGWVIYRNSINNTDKINVRLSSGDYHSTVAPSTNTWEHWALVRNGTTLTWYKDGIAAGSYTGISANITDSGIFYSGYTQTWGGYFGIGYISDLRIIKGTAVYTGNFAPPTGPLLSYGTTSTYTNTANVNTTFPAANTSLLTYQNPQPTNNSMFLDKSNNSFVITRNGNSTQGTFSPYGSTWSNYFGSSSNYLTLPTATASAWGGFNGNITTIEFWAYLTTSATAQGSTGWIIGTIAGVVSNGRWQLLIGGGAATVGAPSKVYWYWTNSSTTGTFVETTQVVPINQWTHIAIVTNATGSAGSHTATIYVDGVGQTFTGLDFSSQTFTYDNLKIGGANDSMPGWIHGLRIVRAPTNVVGYSGSTITVPAAPVGVVANTLLLTCTTNGFKDLSNVTPLIGYSGTPLVQKFNPYTPIFDSSLNPKLNNAYTPSINGGSSYFDGTGDYLNIATSPSLSPSSNPFTMECWVYVISNGGGNRGIFALGASNAGSQALMIYQEYTQQKFGIYNGSSGVLSTDTIQLNTWTHLAYVREGTGSNQTKLYVNGKLSATTTFNNTFVTPMPAYIGENAWGELFQGYISDARFVNGTAVYTGNFDPPNRTLLPYGTSTTYSNTANVNTTFAAANTSLLLNFTDAAIYDATMNVNLETVADARVSTANSKFGGFAMLFDGTGDYLAYTGGTSLNFGTGNFTIELWVYLANNGTFNPFIRPDASGSFVEFGYDFSTGQLKFDARDASIVAVTTTMPTNQWTHVAACRSGTSLRLFINGTQVGSTTTNSTNFGLTTGTIRIGGSSFSGSHVISGYIDDLRITKFARYTANFTPPTESFRLK